MPAVTPRQETTEFSMKTDFKVLLPDTKQPLTLSTEDVLYVLRVRNLNIKEFGERIGLKRTTASMAIHGQRVSAETRQKITDGLAALLSEIPKPQRMALLKVA
jgi:hypothetical protein